MKLRLTLGYVILLAAACGSDEPSLPSAECAADAGPVPAYSEVEAFTTCNVCHSSKLSGAARREGKPVPRVDGESNFRYIQPAEPEGRRCRSGAKISCLGAPHIRRRSKSFTLCWHHV